MRKHANGDFAPERPKITPPNAPTSAPKICVGWGGGEMLVMEAMVRVSDEGKREERKRWAGRREEN